MFGIRKLKEEVELLNSNFTKITNELKERMHRVECPPKFKPFNDVQFHHWDNSADGKDVLLTGKVIGVKLLTDTLSIFGNVYFHYEYEIFVDGIGVIGEVEESQFEIEK